MFTLHPQFVVDENQVRKAVVLSLEEWDRVVEELEELDDIRAYDKAKSEKQDTIPFDQALRELGIGGEP